MWQEYDNRQQDVLGLVTENELEAEQVTFLEMEDIYEDVIDEASGIIKGKLRAAEDRKKSGARPDKPSQDKLEGAGSKDKTHSCRPIRDKTRVRLLI